MDWNASDRAFLSLKAEDEGSMANSTFSQSSESLIGSSEREPFTLSREVKQLLYDRSRYASLPPDNTTALRTHALDDTEQSSPEEVHLRPIQFYDGYQGLDCFPNALKAQLEQAYASQETELPSCVKTRWPKTYAGGLSDSNHSHVWYDYKLGQELLVARFLYGNQHQVLIAKYANEAGAQKDHQPFIITWASGAWRRWDPEGFVHEPQHIERESRTHLDNADVHSTLSAAQSNISETSEDILVAEKANGTLVQLKCHKCKAKTYNTQQGLFFHLRYSHGIFLKSYDEVADVCGRPLKPTLRRSDRITKRKRNFDPPPAECSTPVKHRTGRNHLSPIVSSNIDSHNPGAYAGTTSMADENTKINFIFSKSEDNRSPRTRPLSACNSVEKLMVNALIAGVANRDTLMFTIEVNNNDPMYVMRGDAADFGQVLDVIKQTDKEQIDVVVTVEELH